MEKNYYTKKYDNVIIFNVLEHVSDINIALKNINLLLKENGKLFGSTPFIYRIMELQKIILDTPKILLRNL